LQTRSKEFGACTGIVRASGYSLIELVTVIALLAIISAVAVPRFFDQRVFAERGYADELAAALRMAQKAAVASGCTVRVQINAAGYSAAQQPAVAGHCDATSGNWSTPVASPDGQVLSGSTPNDVVPPADTIVMFDGSGRAIAGANQALTIGPRTLTVEASSGFVTLT